MSHREGLEVHQQANASTAERCIKFAHAWGQDTSAGTAPIQLRARADSNPGAEATGPDPRRVCVPNIRRGDPSAAVVATGQAAEEEVWFWRQGLLVISTS